MIISYTITGGLIHLSGNPIEIVITADTPRLNHRLAVKVKCNSLLNPEQVEEWEPTNLVAKINIQGLVDEPLPIDFHYPITGVATGHLALVLNVSLEIGEIWDDENGDRVEDWTVIEEELRIIDGKLRQHELAVLNETGKSFASEYINGGKFLTSLPNFQKVAPAEFVKLWYLSRWTDDHPATLRTKVNLNNKVAHVPMSQEVVLYAITGLLELSINPIFQGFELDPGETIESFVVWLEDAEGDISERRTFLVDNNHYENQLFGYYRNKFSAVDHFWFRGNQKEGISTTVETSYTSVVVGARTKSASIKTINSSGQRYWEISTGVLPRKEILSLREFLEAKEKWIIDPDNPLFTIPIYTEGGEYVLNDTMEDLQNCQIKLIEAHV